MNEQLEQRLVALGEALEIPQTPDLVPAVIARLPDRRAHAAWRPRVTRPARRSLALALAALLLLAAVAFAVPSTRHTILRVFGLRGVAIERVPKLPALPPGSGKRLALGQRIAVDRARHAASFTALLTPHPTATYLATDVAGGRLSVIDGGALITEFRGTTIPIVLKLIGPGTQVAQQVIDGSPSVYLSGAPHEVLFMTTEGAFKRERVRLAGNVLAWQRGAVTVLIEGTHTLDQALAVARSLR
ncbi:MAG TPA: hypothetical protein VGF93_10305 [Solirubrobacteraceae bacterium]|jgi:hypothetical protein